MSMPNYDRTFIITSLIYYKQFEADKRYMNTDENRKKCRLPK